MFWDDAEWRDELGRMGLLPDENGLARDGLAVMALVSDEESGASADDTFSLWPFRHVRVLRSGRKSGWLPSSRLGHLPTRCRAIA